MRIFWMVLFSTWVLGCSQIVDKEGDKDGGTDAAGDADADTDTDTDSDSDADTDADTDSDTDADTDTDADADTDADTDADGDADGDTDGDADGDIDGDSDGDADGDTDGDSDSDTDTTTDIDTGTSTNDPPEITSIASSTATEDELYTYSPTAIDPEGHNLTWQISNEPDGMSVDSAIGTITWTPEEGVLTSGEVTLTVTDEGTPPLSDTETILITVTPVNDPPEITSVAPTSATEQVLYRYQPTVNDPEQGTLTWELRNEPPGMTIDTNTGEITWTPPSGTTTSGEINLSVIDDADPPLSDEQVFTIQVVLVNHPPVINSTAPTTAIEHQLYQYNAEAEDPDGGALTWSLENEPSGMTVDSITGIVSWTPGEGVTTSGEVTLTVIDNASPPLSDSETFTIAVTPVNNAPVISSTAPTSAVEHETYLYEPHAEDPEGDPVSWSLENEPQGMTIVSTTGMVTWTPGEGITTSGSVTLIASDHSLSDTQVFTVTVSPVNNAPDITTQAPTTVVEHESYRYEAEAVDPENDSLTWALINEPEDMVVNPSTGVVTWTPGEGVESSGEVTLTVTDDGSPRLTDLELFTVTVSPYNDPPEITSTPVTTATEHEPYSYTLTAHDPESNAITWSLQVAPAGMTIGANSGVISWTPQEGVSNNESVTVRATDNGSPNRFSEQSYDISVTLVNDTPYFTDPTPGSGPVQIGTIYQVSLTAEDPEGGTVAITLENEPPGMSYSPSTKEIIWSVDRMTMIVGTEYTVTVIAEDGGGETATHQWTLTVAPHRWTLMNSTMNSMTYSFAAQDSETVYQFLESGDGCWRTVNGGEDWNLLWEPSANFENRFVHSPLVRDNTMYFWFSEFGMTHYVQQRRISDNSVLYNTEIDGFIMGFDVTLDNSGFFYVYDLNGETYVHEHGASTPEVKIGNDIFTNCLAAVPTGNYSAYTGGDNEIWRRGTESWDQLGVSPSLNVTSIEVASDNADRLYLISDENDLYYGSGYGSLTLYFTAIDLSGTKVAAIETIDDNVGWILDDTGKVYFTNDNFIHYIQEELLNSSGNSVVIETIFVAEDGTTIFAYGNGHFFRY